MRNLVRDAVREANPHVKVVLVDLEMSADLDVESLDMLAALCDELRAQDIDLWLARSGLMQKIGAGRVYRRIGDGVTAYRSGPR